MPLKLAQFVGHRLADQVWPGAEHLAQLDKRRAQIGQSQPNTGLERLV